MTDPGTALTASMIATLAFQKFIESSAGELAKKFSTEAIVKMDTLQKCIWRKLRSKSRIDALREASTRTGKITPEQIDQIVAYLQVAMDEDPQFATEIQSLAQNINEGRLVDQIPVAQTMMIQNNHGSVHTSQVTVTNQSTAYFGGIHIKGKLE